VLLLVAGITQIVLAGMLAGNVKGLADQVRSRDFPPGIYFGPGGFRLGHRDQFRARNNRISGWFGIVIGAVIVVIAIYVFREGTVWMQS
jgi:hypothetical protein